jgi:hypothetical protein
MTVWCYELFGSAAGIRSSGTALRLLNCDGAIDQVNFGKRFPQRRAAMQAPLRS